MTDCRPCIRHVMPSWFHLMGVALYCNFFYPLFFFVAVGFLFDSSLQSFPSFCTGPTARPSIFKCLLNNVGLVKAHSSFLLALSRSVLLIKHVSVSTRHLATFFHSIEYVLQWGNTAATLWRDVGLHHNAVQTVEQRNVFILNNVTVLEGKAGV